MKNTKYVAFLCLLALVVFGCSTIVRDTQNNFPVESFTQVKKTHIINICTVVEGEQVCTFSINPGHFLGPKLGVGSGVIVGHTDRSTLILTAAHVCSSPIEKEKNLKEKFESRYPGIRDIKFPEPIGDYENVKEIKVETTLFVADLENKLHVAKVVDKIDSHDLCLLQTIERLNYPVVPFASDPPPIGEEVYNTAAPLGIFKKGMVPLFSGYFAGLCDDETFFCPKRAKESFVYTSMVIAPGSSGSPVYRKINGKFYLFSVIHSVHIHLPEIAYGTTYDQTKNFLNRALGKAYAEAALRKAIREITPEDMGNVAGNGEMLDAGTDLEPVE